MIVSSHPIPVLKSLFASGLQATNMALESPPLQAVPIFRRHITTAIFSRLLLWFSNRPPSVTIYVLRVPADDSKPHILPLETIDVCRGKCGLLFYPDTDMRAFWGRGESWKWRDIMQCTIIDQNPDISGVYLSWKSFALHLLPLNKNASGCGDVFIGPGV